MTRPSDCSSSASTMAGRLPHASLGACLLGLGTGAAFGWSWAWLVALLSQAALFHLHHRAPPSTVARLLGCWAVGLYAGGNAAFVLGAPASLSLWAALIATGYVLWQAGCCTLAAYGIARLAQALRCEHAFGMALWPLAWMALEWLHGQGSLAMPWLRLGQMQAPDGPLAPLLPLGGSLLTSGAMWALAACLHGALVARRWLPLTAAASLLVLITTLQPTWTTPEPALPVTLAQPGQTLTSWKQEGGAPSTATAQALMAHYAQVVRTSAPGLILTPQLALPKTDTALPAPYFLGLQQSLEARQADLLLGLYFEAPDGLLYNGVLTLGPSGEQRYLKAQPFPFGEFVPLSGAPRRVIEHWAGRAIQDAARGPTDQPPLTVAGIHVAPTICFEAAFPAQWRARAAQAQLLVNIASDSALHSVFLQRQFVQLLQARAMEVQKPVARTSDVAGTYLIAADGKLTHHLPAERTATLSATVTPRQGLTPWARWGDAFAFAVAALFAAATLAASRRPAPPQPHLHAATQRGQVMLPAVVLILLTVALLYLMVNSGQAVNEKMRVTNAADAAAYSAGVVEARALNYDAYLNRAIVANEMAIAQAISVGSWMQYMGKAVDQGYPGNASDINFMLGPPADTDDLTRLAQLQIAYIALARAFNYMGTTGQEFARRVTNFGVMPIVYMSDGVAQALSLSQAAVHANLVAGLRQGQIANDVVKAIDPELRAEVVHASHGFDTFTKRYAGDERGRLADVSMRSRDDFTRERNWEIESWDIWLLRKNGALKKRSGTELIGYDEWRGLDTLELHGNRFGCGRFSLSWCDDIRRPIGWGGMSAVKGSDRGRGLHGGAWRDNPTTALAAEREKTRMRFSGLPATRDLAKVEPTDPDPPPSTAITILVRKPHGRMLTSGGLAQAKPSGRLELFDAKPAGSRLVALSRANVYFDRIAARADGKTERASLYNPYWRVRLVAPTAADKAWAAAQQQGLALP